MISKMIIEESELNANSSLTAYVKKCVEICWAMCLHEPPVHIDLSSREGNEQKFDTNTYKAYTKNGKLLDFVVWPPLYLHKNGPLLAKGVAQAKGPK